MASKAVCWWQVIAINGKFPGPVVNVTTNWNVVVNVLNDLDEPLLITWYVPVNTRPTFRIQITYLPKTWCSAIYDGSATSWQSTGMASNTVKILGKMVFWAQIARFHPVGIGLTSSRLRTRLEASSTSPPSTSSEPLVAMEASL